MQLPQNAKKIFSGEIFDTYQWPQEMFDGSTETFEMLYRTDTIQVIATKGEKILLALEEQPMIKRGYGLFGGRMDKGESPLECAKRELLEESGHSSEDWELLKTYEPYHKMDWTLHLFIARNCQKVSEQKLDAGEKIEIKEVNFDKFVDIAINEPNFSGKEITIDIARIKINDGLDEFKQKIFK